MMVESATCDVIHHFTRVAELMISYIIFDFLGEFTSDMVGNCLYIFGVADYA